MKINFSLLLIPFFLLNLSSCRKKEDLLIIGMDNNGRELEVKVNKDQFLQSASQTFSEINDSTHYFNANHIKKAGQSPAFST